MFFVQWDVPHLSVLLHQHKHTDWTAHATQHTHDTRGWALILFHSSLRFTKKTTTKHTKLKRFFAGEDQHEVTDICKKFRREVREAVDGCNSGGGVLTTGRNSFR